MSTSARTKVQAVVCRLCRARHKRHTAAMELLRSGVGCTVIALWLGHESVETTQIYLHADIEIKKQAMDQTRPAEVTEGVYRPDDKLRVFLDSL